ncbi:MAG: AMP-binding protein, partial [Thermoanaerobaculia bacterium]
MFDGDLLAERARITPDKLALVSIETGERLTYAELSERADRAAAMLSEAGIREGERFGILAHNSIDYIALFFAAGRVGAIVVPLSTRSTAHELSQIAKDCGMKAFWYGPEFAEIANQLPVASCRLPAMQHLAAGNRQPATGNPDGEAVYCLLYTSGT